MYALSSYCRLEAVAGACREGILKSLTTQNTAQQQRSQTGMWVRCSATKAGRIALTQGSQPIEVEDANPQQQSQNQGFAVISYCTAAELVRVNNLPKHLSVPKSFPMATRGIQAWTVRRPGESK